MEYIVRIVFATVALGMGVNFVGLNRVIHYGAPSSIGAMDAKWQNSRP